MSAPELSPFAEFEILTTAYRMDNPAQRAGQAAFNTLAAVHPEIADKVTADFRVDPFYDDDRLPRFMEFVRDQLDGGRP